MEKVGHFFKSFTAILSFKFWILNPFDRFDNFKTRHSDRAHASAPHPPLSGCRPHARAVVGPLPATPAYRSGQAPPPGGAHVVDLAVHASPVNPSRVRCAHALPHRPVGMGCAGRFGFGSGQQWKALGRSRPNTELRRFFIFPFSFMISEIHINF
jgi:hypothetical protein